MSEQQNESSAASTERPWRMCDDGYACLAPDCPCERRFAEKPNKLGQLYDDIVRLERWAGEQNAGNAFAGQVRMWAQSKLDEWNLPVEEWEP